MQGNVEPGTGVNLILISWALEGGRKWATHAGSMASRATAKSSKPTNTLLAASPTSTVIILSGKTC